MRDKMNTNLGHVIFFPSTVRNFKGNYSHQKAVIFNVPMQDLYSDPYSNKKKKNPNDSLKPEGTTGGNRLYLMDAKISSVAFNF